MAQFKSCAANANNQYKGAAGAVYEVDLGEEASVDDCSLGKEESEVVCVLCTLFYEFT